MTQIPVYQLVRSHRKTIAIIIQKDGSLTVARSSAYIPQANSCHPRRKIRLD